MNIEKLLEAEALFVEKFPGGFEHPTMLEIAKKHKPEKMQAFAIEKFEKQCFDKHQEIIENWIKLTTMSSMVSVFEKPKFRDFLRALPDDQKKFAAENLYSLLYDNEQFAFENLNDLLKLGKINKWTVLTVLRAYRRPDYDVFVKPTTAKGTINYFEIQGLKYSASPSFEFYSRYRDVINEMKSHTTRLNTDNNAAFSGFLMIAMGEYNPQSDSEQ